MRYTESMPKHKTSPKIRRRKTAQKTQSRLKRFTRSLPLLLVVTGVLMMGIWGAHRFFYRRSLALPDSVLSQYQGQETARRLPVFIDIDGIGRLPVDEGRKINGVWTIADDAANHVAQSALPGDAGNIIIYGHNTRKIFGRLIEKKPGDYVSVTTADGKLHQYRIFQTFTVSPSRTDLLSPTTGETLTLYTCTGFLDSKRFVVRALPVFSD